MKRTTIVLDDCDIAVLEQLRDILHTSDMEAIRRSMRLALHILAFQHAGGSVILENNTDQTKIQFVV